MTHGTVSGYQTHGCRCMPCRDARRDYDRRRAEQRREMASQPGLESVDRQVLADILVELFPDGLTDDCPAQRARRQKTVA
jgi:hypothetical protein